MHLDPTTPEGAAYIADHLNDIDGLHYCGDCDDVFSDAKDTDYGVNNERTCKRCCIEINAGAR